MTRQHGKHCRELLCVQHDHCGCLAASQRFQPLNQRRVARIESERTLLGQGV
jgi:hypothetical protein